MLRNLFHRSIPVPRTPISFSTLVAGFGRRKSPLPSLCSSIGFLELFHSTVSARDSQKMCSVQERIEELTTLTLELRRKIQKLESKDCKEREKIVLKHIKEFASNGTPRVTDFQKGLEWFNVSEGLSINGHLKGKIVVLDFFTYCCINCMHILPDLDALEKKFSIEDGLVVVGVHSAKFSNERNSDKILSAVQRYNISHPVVNDAKLTLWRTIGIVCWPSLVILGPKGQPLFVMVGEGHREELFLYTKVALDYFKSLNEISSHSLPLQEARHLLPAKRENVLLFPGKVAILNRNGTDKVIVSDSGNHRILVTNAKGNVESVIGGCDSGFVDGDFQMARFNAPQGVCVLENCIFVADNENHAIRKIDLDAKKVTTVAGNGSQGHDYIGGKSGKNQELSSPWDVSIYYHSQEDGSEVPVLLIAIAGTHQIWALFLKETIWWKKKRYESGTCAAIVGSGREENRNNSYPHAAGLAQPSGLAVAQKIKALFFADSESSSIRRVDLEDGKVSAVCGADKNPSNLHNFGDVDGPKYTAKLQHPLGVAWSNVENKIYVADTYNHKIKVADVLGNCATLYGNGKPTPEHSFSEPSGLAISSNGNLLYIADTNNHRIKIVETKSQSIQDMKVDFDPEETECKEDGKFNYELNVSTKQSELSILLDVKFREEGLKLELEAPQKWTVTLPKEEQADFQTFDNLMGDLQKPIIVHLSGGTKSSKVRTTLNLVACRKSECLPKKIVVNLNINRSEGAPSDVKFTKVLEID